MNLLLDTHAFLWWIIGSEELSPSAYQVIRDGSNTIYWSAASSWEVAIKHALGRLEFVDTPEEVLLRELSKNRVESLPINNAHAFRAGQLPRYHRDPFDRMLVAQAQIESLILVSNDESIKKYDVELLW